MKNIFIIIKNKIKISIDLIYFCYTISRNSSKYLTITRIVLEMISAFLPFLTIFISSEIINILVYISANKNNSNDSLHTFIFQVSIVVILQICMKIMEKVKEFCMSIHNDYITNNINTLIAEKSISLDLSYFDSAKYYNEIMNVNRDAFSIQTLIWNIIRVISTIITLLISFTVLSRLNFVFGLLLIATVVPSMISERRYTEKVFNWQINNVPDERKMRYTLNMLSGRAYAKEIRMYNIGNVLLAKYQKIWHDWFNKKRIIIIKKTFLVCVLSILPELCLAGVMYYVGLSILYGKLTIGDYSLYIGIISQMIGGLYSFIYFFSSIIDNSLRITNIKKFLEWENTTNSFGNLITYELSNIEFRNVSFKYPGSEKQVLDNISFNIICSKNIAIVGLNGAGKSTIVKLILRYYDPDEGIILINGINIKEYDLHELRKCFSTLFQDYINYAFTIRENIYLSDIQNKKNEEKIFKACDKSGAQSMIENFKDGLDTFLTREFENDGIELSGGEWQKIALARAFFKESRMVILDEPSSSLDPESEHHIFEMIAELCKGKGSIFISHRLSNIVMADRIIVLDNGKIIEDGTHSNLIKLNGKYAYLFNLQAEKYRVS